MTNIDRRGWSRVGIIKSMKMVEERKKSWGFGCRWASLKLNDDERSSYCHRRRKELSEWPKVVEPVSEIPKMTGWL